MDTSSAPQPHDPTAKAATASPRTPDNRYLVVRGRLWRCTDPAIDPERRALLVSELMAARRAVKDAKGDRDAIAAARVRVHAAKHALGERGTPWWTDGAPDHNRRLVRNTPYATWYENLQHAP